MKMADPIDRQTAIELVKDVCDAIMSGCKRHYDSEVGDEVYDDTLEVDAILKCNKGIRNALRDMPPAQPEIVRCKERKQGEWDMFNLITSVYFGKQYYFPEEDGIVYSRQSGKNMTREKAIQEFLDIIGE